MCKAKSMDGGSAHRSFLAGSQLPEVPAVTPPPLRSVVLSWTLPRLREGIKKVCIKLRLIHRISTKASLCCGLM